MMDKIEILGLRDGETKTIALIPCDDASHNTAIMGKNELSISVVTDSPLNLIAGDYALIDGVTYRMNRDAELTQKSDVQHEYTLTFEAPVYTLIDKILCNKITGSTTVTLTGKLRDFLELLIWNVNYDADSNPLGIDTGWEIGLCPDTDYMNITLETVKCRDALDTLASKYGLEYYVTNKTINYVSHIENETGLVFTQGKGGGLYEVEQKNVDDGDLVTRAYIKGGTDNVIPGEGDLQGRLVLPEGYIENFSESSRVVEAEVEFSDIHPTFQGTVGTVSGDNNREFLCPEMDFDIADVAVGDEARVNFLTGDLLGKSFEFKWDNTLKKITLIYQEDDLAAIDANTGKRPNIPSTSKYLRGGELFNFTGLKLSGTYKTNAITKLREKGTDWLAYYCRKRVKFELNVDYRFLRKNNTELHCGDLITINIPLHNISKLIRITDIEKNLHTGKMTCTVSNYLDEKWEKKIEEQISDIQSSTTTVNGGYGGASSVTILEKNDEREASDSNVFSALRALKEIAERALSRKNDDSAAGLITFIKGLVSKKLITAEEGILLGTFVTGNSGAKIDVNGDAEVRNLIARIKAKVTDLEVTNTARAKNVTVSDKVTTLNLLVQQLADTYNLNVSNVATLFRTTIKDYVSSETFISGFAGEGFKLYKALSGDWNLEVDNVTIRKAMTIFELIISKIRSVNGGLVVSQGNGRIKSVSETTGTPAYYVLGIEGDMTFEADDFVRCQVFSSTGAKYYWVRVDSISDDSIIIAQSEFPEGTVPAVGDDLIQMGNKTNTARQGLLYLTASEDGKPRFSVLDGVDSTDLTGKNKLILGCLDGITDSDFPDDAQPSGYGLWAANVFLKGLFILRNGKSVEDELNDQITAVQTAFEIREGQISTKVQAATAAATQAAGSASFAAGSASTAGSKATSAANSATAAAGSATTAGEKASDATKAASDAQDAADNASDILSKVTTKESSINQTADNITLQVKDVTTKVTTATNKASEAATSASNAAGSASTAGSKASAAATSATNAKTSETNAAGSASTASAKATAASNSAKSAADSASQASGILVTVTQKETSINQTADAIELKAVRAESAASRAETAEASINVKADGIVMQAASSAAQTAVDGVHIGGLNLLLNSKGSKSGTSYNVGYWNSSRSFIVGETLTVSIKGNIPGSKLFGIWFNSGSYGGYSLQKVNDGLYSKTITVPGNTSTVTIGIYLIGNQSAGDSWNFEWIKLESGNKATDWTPAPEDVSADATSKANAAQSAAQSYADGKFTTKTDFSAQLTILNNSISSKVAKTDFNALGTRVSNAETTISQHTSQIALKAAQSDLTALGTRVSSAETKITPDAIKLTVKSQTESIAQTAVDGLQAGGENLLRNGDFSAYSTNSSIGWDNSLNGTYSISYWGTGYNSGVGSPTIGYHAHLNTAKFGFPVLEYINKNSAYSLGHRWMGISTSVYDKEKLLPGQQYTFSADVMVDTSGMYIHGGIYSRKKGGTSYGFNSGSYVLAPSSVNVWQRVSYTFALDANIDLSQGVSFYIYGMNGSEGIAWVKNASLQLGTKGAYVRCNGDIASDIDLAQNSAVSTAASDATTKANNAKSGAISEIVSSFTITTNGITIGSKTIALTGKVTFSSLDSSTQSTINGKATTAYVDSAKSTAISTAASDASTKANNALASAKSYSDTLKNSLGSLAYLSAVSLAKLDTTIVEGGYIKTSLIDANAVVTDTLLASKISTTDITTSKLTVTNGAKIGNWTITNGGLRSYQANGTLEVYHNGGRFLNINDTLSTTLMSIRADGGTGISIYTQDTTGRCITMTAQTGGTAIQSYGNHLFTARTGELIDLVGNVRVGGMSVNTYRTYGTIYLTNNHCWFTATVATTKVYLPSSPTTGKTIFVCRGAHIAVTVYANGHSICRGGTSYISSQDINNDGEIWIFHYDGSYWMCGRFDT